MNSKNQQDRFFLLLAVALAEENVEAGRGGPFGAIITLDDKVIATGTNLVTHCLDPTAHAEISAIREACRRLGSFQLEECTLYASCEPCPMCLGAIYWAHLKRLVFSADKQQAERAGFDDAFIYKEIMLPYRKRKLKTKQISLQDDNLPFDLWINSDFKTEY